LERGIEKTFVRRGAREGDGTDNEGRGTKGGTARKKSEGEVMQVGQVEEILGRKGGAEGT